MIRFIARKTHSRHFFVYMHTFLINWILASEKKKRGYCGKLRSSSINHDLESKENIHRVKCQDRQEWLSKRDKLWRIECVWRNSTLKKSIYEEFSAWASLCLCTHWDTHLPLILFSWWGTGRKWGLQAELPTLRTRKRKGTPKSSRWPSVRSHREARKRF